MPPSLPFLSFDPATRRASLDARDPAFFGDPNRAYAALHAHGPAFFWDEQQRWYLIAYDPVNAALRDRRLGRQITHLAPREALGLPPPKPHLAAFDRAESRSLLELEPPEHTRLRALVHRAFLSRQIERLRPEIAALSHQLIDAFEPRGEVELLSQFADVLPVTIIARMLGVPVDMGPQLLAWSHAYVRMYQFGRTEADEHAANRAAAEFSDYVLRLVRDRRRAPTDDLLTHMVTADRDGHRMTDDDLVSTAIVLLNAGHEATVHQIGNAVRLLLTPEPPSEPSGSAAPRRPRARPAIDVAPPPFADPAATERTVEECLRLAAPVHIFDRWVLEDLTLDAIPVPLRRGDRVGLILGAANVDPAKFTDPLRFDPQRAEAPHLSFGAGIHYCIGAPLARLELTTALPLLFERLPHLRLAAEPVVKDVYHFHGLERLDLTF